MRHVCCHSGPVMVVCELGPELKHAGRVEAASAGWIGGSEVLLELGCPGRRTDVGGEAMRADFEVGDGRDRVPVCGSIERLISGAESDYLG